MVAPIIYQVDKDEFITCDYKDECFEIATWYVEGGFYCEKHKEVVLNLLKKGGFQTT
jgi:hypothetical protein